MKEVLCFSAGIDSLIAWRFLYKPFCLHVIGNTRYWFEEMEAVLRVRSAHPKMKLDINSQTWLRDFEEEDANIAARNLLFVDIAAHYGDKIYLVAQRGEQSIPDRSPEFFSRVSELLSFLYNKEKIVSPVFGDKTKADMVMEYLQRGFPPEELWSTYSCFTKGPGRCGRCKACFRTAWALDYANILPNDFFKEDVWKWDNWADYVERIGRGEIEERRAEQTMVVLKKRGIV